MLIINAFWHECNLLDVIQANSYKTDCPWHILKVKITEFPLNQQGE